MESLSGMAETKGKANKRKICIIESFRSLQCWNIHTMHVYIHYQIHIPMHWHWPRRSPCKKAVLGKKHLLSPQDSAGVQVWHEVEVSDSWQLETNKTRGEDLAQMRNWTWLWFDDTFNGIVIRSLLPKDDVKMAANFNWFLNSNYIEGTFL